MRKISSKQASRERKLSQIKLAKLQAQIDKDGYTHCEQCHTHFSQDSGRFFLQLDHIKQRSLCGEDSDENTRLLCNRCHQWSHEWEGLSAR